MALAWAWADPVSRLGKRSSADPGWAFKRLRVDLTSHQHQIEPLAPDLLAQWLGGRGLNAQVFWAEGRAGEDPFTPENPLCLAVGPLTGSLAPCSGWFHAASRSPLLYPPAYAGINVGGHWGPELKFAGYDQLVVVGAAKRPVYLWIDGQDVQLRDARHLWGRDTRQTALLIQDELADRQVEVLAIGPAGERRVRFASLICSFSWAGERLGLGAVMGAKNLKAIAVRGERPVEVADSPRFLTSCLAARQKIAQDAGLARLASEGTLFLLAADKKNGLTVCRNNRQGSLPSPGTRLDLREYQRRYFRGQEACFACPVSCGRYTFLPRGSSDGSYFGGLHAEGVLSLGPGIGLRRWEPLLNLIQTCLLTGLDPASTGGVIAWAMDCRQAGVLTSQEAGDLTLGRGVDQAALELIWRVVSGRGWGDQLGQGALRAARELGQGAEELVRHINGLEMIGPDSCLAPASALSLAISPGEWDPLKFVSGLEFQQLTGHQGESGPPYGSATDLADQIESVARSEEERVSAESLGLCPFPNAYFQVLGLPELSEQFTGLTGIGLDEARLRRIVTRILTLERLLAGRDGHGRREDASAERYFEEEAEGGPSQGAGLERASWDVALARYYQIRGWDLTTGLPSREAAADLDLKTAAEEAQGAIEAYQRRP